MKSYKRHLLSEARLKDATEVKLNFKDADFWLQRKGSMDTVGTPTKVFSKEHIGVKVTRTDVLVPDFLFYYMQNLHNQGYFKQYAKGTLNLVNIQIKDVRDIRL